MSEISHSVRFAKQAKNLLTVQSVQLTWHDVHADVADDELADDVVFGN
jgi:hypothetical protein